MTRDPFENRLQAMFDEPPAFDDTLAFAARVEQRVSRSARWRADMIVAAWIVAGAAALWGLLVSLDAPTLAITSAQFSTAFNALQGEGGVWFVPAAVIGGVLLFQVFEDMWARD